MNDEAQLLLNKYTAQMQALMESFRIEATALAWQIAAKLVAEALPERIAVGTLSYDGKQTKAVMSAPKKHKPQTKVIKGSGKIPSSKPESFKHILFEQEAGRALGLWSRRGSTKVTYKCVGRKGTLNGTPTTIYLMKNEKTRKTIEVKFDSIVRDWTYADAGHDEMLRQAA